MISYSTRLWFALATSLVLSFSMIGCGEDGPLSEDKEEEEEDADEDGEPDNQGPSGVIGGGGGNNAGNPEDPESIFGLWAIEECVAPESEGEGEGEGEEEGGDFEFRKESYLFNVDGTLLFKMAIFGAEGCAEDSELFHFEMEADWVIGDDLEGVDDASEIDFTITAGRIFLAAEDAQSFFNEGDGMCGKTDWEVGVETSLEGLDCGDGTEGPPSIGVTQYDAVGIVDGLLYFGDSKHFDEETETETTYDGTSAENRPVSLKEHDGYEKQPAPE